ncbi:MAG: hypothetical protein PHS41_10890 [Victivallaceae bacterium]|nr:hypothetical protein [Victivallaceae bacterium]
MKAYQYMIYQRRRLVFWAVWNVFCLCALGFGMYWSYHYMIEPDTVIVVGDDGSIGIGHTSQVICDETIRNTAKMAADLMLNRSFEGFDKRLAGMVFALEASEDVLKVIEEDKPLFDERKIVQLYVEKEYRTGFNESTGYPRAFMTGTIQRYSFVAGLATPQKFKYKLNIEMQRDKNLTKFPLRVTRMFYELEEITESFVKEF